MKTPRERLFAGFPACRSAIFALPNASVVVYDARDGNIPLLMIECRVDESLLQVFRFVSFDSRSGMKYPAAPTR